MYEYSHYCVPVKEKPENASYVPLLDCFVTDCAEHPMSFEYLYIPEENTKLPKELGTEPHLAFNVDNYDELVSQSRVLIEFICPYDDISRVAFLEYQQVIIEIKEMQPAK